MEAGAEPLQARLAAHVFGSGKIFADDRPIPVLDPGRGRTNMGRLWVYTRDDRPWGGSDPPAAVYFFYSPDRKAERPASHLERFQGTGAKRQLPRDCPNYAEKEGLRVGRRVLIARNSAELKLHNLLLCAWTNYMICKRVKGRPDEVQMSESVSFRDVPGRFLDQRKWRALRKFTSQELIALTYINAPYPDEENPGNFLGGRSGSAEDAIRCYHTGRSLLQQCRDLLNAGQLVASGVDRSSGKRRTISASEWVNLWPMFATNTAAGPDQAFDDINVFQAEHRNTSHETLYSKCTAWLKEQRTACLGEKKTTLYEDARHKLGNSLTHAIFDAAYLAAFGRRRGRPKKSSI